MAGEWIKFECNLPEKPEVLAITAALGWDDPDLAVGKLMRLFRWFDQQTIGGNAASVTPALLDRIIGVSGFAQAVADVGWLHFNGQGVSLEKFDRHNGASAKARAQTAKRVSNHRGNAKGNGPDNADRNAPTVTGALAREEKKRNTPQPPEGEPAGFVRFWEAWPKSQRKEARGKCLEAWRKAGAESRADQILAHVEGLKLSAGWTKDGGQFIPAPLVYLRNRRWEGAEDAEQSQRGEVFV